MSPEYLDPPKFPRNRRNTERIFKTQRMSKKRIVTTLANMGGYTSEEDDKRLFITYRGKRLTENQIKKIVKLIEGS